MPSPIEPGQFYEVIQESIEDEDWRWLTSTITEMFGKVFSYVDSDGDVKEYDVDDRWEYRNVWSVRDEIVRGIKGAYGYSIDDVGETSANRSSGGASETPDQELMMVALEALVESPTPSFGAEKHRVRKAQARKVLAEMRAAAR